MMLKLYLICIFYTVTAFCQSETGYWTKADYRYEINNNSRQRDYSFYSKNLQGILVEGVTKSYWFLISDLDGDNCPFRPSCSEFLSESINKTNILQGTLMFFDRFSRDLNFIDRHNHYERTTEGYLSDPPENYIF